MRCNIMNRIRKRLLFLFLVCIAMGTLNIGCSEDATPESDNKILKPIAENVIGKWNIDEAQKTLAEKLIGKWNFSKSYEKKNGEWVEISFGLPNEGWYLYREDGSFTVYSRNGEDEKTSDMNWSVNNVTGELRWVNKDGQSSEVNVVIEEDGTLSVFYLYNLDPSTGQAITGEFQDVLIR